MERIEAAIPALASQLRRDGGEGAARAIMTTDTTVKMVVATDTLGGRTITVGGIAKGSGMIHPNMATMLAFLATDAVIPHAVLQRGLRQAADRSFNRIPVDGDTSTNDMVLCLANGVAIAYGDVPVVRRGTGLGPAAEEQANTVLKGREFALTVDLGLGRAAATVWTTDLSPEYVKINASYRS